MLSEEEKKAIEYFKDDIEFLEEDLKNPNFLGRYITIRTKECNYLKILLNLIEKQQAEIEKWENIKKELIRQEKSIYKER